MPTEEKLGTMECTNRDRKGGCCDSSLFGKHSSPGLEGKKDGKFFVSFIVHEKAFDLAVPFGPSYVSKLFIYEHIILKLKNVSYV